MITSQLFISCIARAERARGRLGILNIFENIIKLGEGQLAKEMLCSLLGKEHRILKSSSQTALRINNEL